MSQKQGGKTRRGPWPRAPERKGRGPWKEPGAWRAGPSEEGEETSVNVDSVSPAQWTLLKPLTKSQLSTAALRVFGLEGPAATWPRGVANVIS